MEPLLQLFTAGAGASACASVRTLHIGIMECDQWPGELCDMMGEEGCAHLTVDLLGDMLLGCFPNITTLHFQFPQHLSVERLIALFPKIVSLSLGNSVVVADPSHLSRCLCLKDLEVNESSFSLAMCPIWGASGRASASLTCGEAALLRILQQQFFDQDGHLQHGVTPVCFTIRKGQETTS